MRTNEKIADIFKGEMMGDQIKVSYLTRTGYQSTAYVDEKTFEGVDKHSDVPLQLEWSDEQDTYVQIDEWKWEFDYFGEPHRKLV